MAHLPLVVSIAQRYQKDPGPDTSMAFVLPHWLVILTAWMLLLVVWFWLGIPLGPGDPAGARGIAHNYVYFARVSSGGG